MRTMPTQQIACAPSVAIRRRSQSARFILTHRSGKPLAGLGYGQSAPALDGAETCKLVDPLHGEMPVRTIMVNVDKMLKGGDLSKNILLEPDDIVFIPPTPLAWFSQRLRELIYPISPAVEAYQAPADVIYADEVYDEDLRNTGVRRTRRR